MAISRKLEQLFEQIFITVVSLQVCAELLMWFINENPHSHFAVLDDRVIRRLRRMIQCFTSKGSVVIRLLEYFDGLIMFLSVLCVCFVMFLLLKKMVAKIC